MKLLYYRWNALTRTDIDTVLTKMGIDFDVISTENNYRDLINEQMHEDFRKAFEKCKYDAVFSINFYHNIAYVCHEYDIPYIAWSYDSPINIGAPEAFRYDTSHVFLFDREDVEELRDEYDKKEIYHLPLAVDTDRYDSILPTNAERRKFKAQVSFVGQLYSNNAEDAINCLPDYEKGYLNAIKDSQLQVYGTDVMAKTFYQDLLKAVSIPEFLDLFKKAVFKEFESVIETVPPMSLWSQMLRDVTHRERLLLLQLMGRHFDTAVYSDDKDHKLQGVRMMGPVNYWVECPKVFKCTDINLNISLRSIRTGIPQRCLDIMGCRSFLLCNYQAELAEWFENGKDCAIYSSIEEAVDLAQYYSTHEVDRKRIVNNGYQKVKNEFTYEKRLQTIFETLGMKL